MRVGHGLRYVRVGRTLGCAGVLMGICVVGAANRVVACDVCAIYSATDMRESRTGLLVGIAEQFTSYNTLQNNGEEVPNPAGERLNSSITQFIGAYTFTPWLSAQINLPVIGRSYRRLEATGVVDGDETGIGDMTVLANAVPFSQVSETSVLRWSVLCGVKLPTGNSDRLQEEVPPPPADDGVPGPFKLPSAPQLVKYHHPSDGEATVESGVHGHDLALGSGSTDVVLGTNVFGSWDRAFVSGQMQYAVRTEGSFGYQYNNDMTWTGGPGVFVLLAYNHTLAIQAAVSGESKGKDSVDGVAMDDTARTGLYVGPGAQFTWGTSLAVDLFGDVSVVQNSSALQVVPDYRLRAGLTWRF